MHKGEAKHFAFIVYNNIMKNIVT